MNNLATHALAGGWAESFHKYPQGTIGVIVLIVALLVFALIVTNRG